MSTIAAPYHLVWGLTNACNIRCVHCYASSAKPDPGELNADEASKAPRSVAEAGVFDIAFSGGEALLRKDVFDLVVQASHLGMATGLGTNGWMVNDVVASRLAKSGLTRMQISINGLASVHEDIRRRRGLFARACQAISSSRNAGLQTNVCFTVHRGNLAQLDDVVNLCLDLGVHGLNVSQFVPTGRGDSELDLETGQWEDLYKRWAEYRQLYRGRLALTSHLSQIALVDPEIACQSGFVGCQAGHGQAAISPTGDVYPCVLLPIRVGNIRTSSLTEIWQSSPILARIRDRSQLGGACGSCELVDKCGGCRALAYAQTGDYMAADTRCWHHKSSHSNAYRTASGRVKNA